MVKTYKILPLKKNKDLKRQSIMKHKIRKLKKPSKKLNGHSSKRIKNFSEHRENISKEDSKSKMKENTKHLKKKLNGKKLKKQKEKTKDKKQIISPYKDLKFLLNNYENDLDDLDLDEVNLSDLPHDEFTPFDIPVTKADYEKYYKKIFNESDILLEIVDCRNIKGTRISKEIEDKIINNSNKKLIIVLNKIDTLLKNNVYYNKLINLKKIGNIDVLITSNFIREKVNEFKDNLSKLVDKFIEKNIAFSKKKLKVGIIGYPFSGKNSLVHSLKLLNDADCTDRFINFENINTFCINSICCNIYENNNDNAVFIPKNEHNITDLNDPVNLIKNIFNIVDKKDISNFYGVSFTGKFDDFIKKISDKFNYNKNVDLTYKHIIRDIIEGNISYFIE